MACRGTPAIQGTSTDVVGSVEAAVKKVQEDASVCKSVEDTGSLAVGDTTKRFPVPMKAALEVDKTVVALHGLRLT